MTTHHRSGGPSGEHPVGGPLPAAAVALLDRAWSELVGAESSLDPAERYVRAHLAALRAAAALVAARGRPRLRGRRALNVWAALSAVAPELDDWAASFSASAERRAAVETGRAVGVSAREADEHVQRAGRFGVVVAGELGLPVPALRLLPLAS